MSTFLASRYRQAELDAKAAAKLDEALRESAEPMPQPKTKAGDPEAMRGFPIAAVPGGFGGAIRGSIPGGGLA